MRNSSGKRTARLFSRWLKDRIRRAIKNFGITRDGISGWPVSARCVTFRSCRAIIVPSVKLQRNRYLNWPVVFAGLMGTRGEQENESNSNRNRNESVSPGISRLESPRCRKFLARLATTSSSSSCWSRVAPSMIIFAGATSLCRAITQTLRPRFPVLNPECALIARRSNDA